MARIEFDSRTSAIAAVAHNARATAHVRRAKMMMAAAGLAAFGIVAVAAAMMMTLF